MKYPCLMKKALDGFCDCGEEASQDKRSCNLLKSTKDIFQYSIREKLEKKFEVEDLPSVVVMKADGTLVSENAVTDIANSRGEELNLVKEKNMMRKQTVF